MNGVACNLGCRGFKALCKATKEIVGHVEPYSITRSLPLIQELHVHENQCSLNSWTQSPWAKLNCFFLIHNEGFDVQTDSIVESCIILTPCTNNFYTPLCIELVIPGPSFTWKGIHHFIAADCWFCLNASRLSPSGFATATSHTFLNFIATDCWSYSFLR
jgi:hypothetical protein